MSHDRNEGEMLRELLRSDIGALIEALRTDMNVQFEGVNARFEDVNAQLDDLRGDLRGLRGEVVKLDRRTHTLAGAIASLRQEIVEQLHDHERRLVRLEGERPER